MTANERQIGGTHYNSALQHWDFVEHYGVGYLEGCITKYITRHHRKNGLQDLEKAEHYLEKLIELYQKGRRSRMFDGVTLAQVENFIIANNLGQLEGEICLLIFSNYGFADLEKARVLLIGLIKTAKQHIVSKDGMENPFGYVPE